MVGFHGALSNPKALRQWRRLLAMRPGAMARKPVPKATRRRQGWIWPAIAAVLSEADEALKPATIYERIVQREVGPVSKSSIKGELRRQLGNPDSRLRQDLSGSYSLLQ